MFKFTNLCLLKTHVITLVELIWSKFYFFVLIKRTKKGLQNRFALFKKLELLDMQKCTHAHYTANLSFSSNSVLEAEIELTRI